MSQRALERWRRIDAEAFEKRQRVLKEGSDRGLKSSDRGVVGAIRWSRLAAWIFAGGLIAAAGLFVYSFMQGPDGEADPDDPAQVALGQRVYAEACAACHGANLEGQPDWRVRLPNGRLPAPPHDASGHTWHHPDPMLFEMTKIGIAAFVGLEGYETDMPAYEGTLSDKEIWAVIAFIKSTWPPEVSARQASITERYQKNR